MEAQGNTYLLGDYLLAPDRRLLSRAGEPVPITSKPFHVLVYLVEHHDRVVGRAELLDRFWDGKDVYDDTLRKTVASIRKALGDNVECPRFIETHYGEGYRYVGPLEQPLSTEEVYAPQTETVRAVRILIEEEELQSSAELGLSGANLSIPNRALDAAATLTRPKRRLRLAAMLSALVLVATAAVAIVHFSRAAATSAPSSSAQSIAVLPLRDLSPDAGSDYLSEGITESLISAISRIDGLRVISHGSVLGFKGKDVDPRQVGAKLGVASVLEGSLQKSGDRMRVQVRLVSAEDGHVLWSSDTYDRAPGDIFAIQDDIARGVTSGLRLKPARDEERALARRYTDSTEAYYAYLKGRYYWNNKKTKEGLQKSLEYFHQAIKIDPQYALAYAGLAEWHITAFWFLGLPSDYAIAEAKKAAARALQIDDTLAEAHIAMATAYGNDWDLLNASRESERAIELEPNSWEAHHGYAYTLIALGRGDQAIAEIQRALELDPLNLSINTDIGEILTGAGRYDSAIAAFKKALEMEPEQKNIHWDLALVYDATGMDDEAFAEYLRCASLSGDGEHVLSAFKDAYARAGLKGFWQKKLQLAKQTTNPLPDSEFIARIYARLGLKDQAFEWLEKAFQKRSPYLVTLKGDPMLAGLHSDPRFAELLRRVGLPV
jgi:TolB-like protein/DNA-binding winged helix-turn-helix (wHTH) protein/tetratricopeptide (TPR) repeat protein